MLFLHAQVRMLGCSALEAILELASRMIERPMMLLLCAESLRRIEGELLRSKSIHTVMSGKYTGLSPWRYRIVCPR